MLRSSALYTLPIGLYQWVKTGHGKGVHKQSLSRKRSKIATKFYPLGKVAIEVLDNLWLYTFLGANFCVSSLGNFYVV